MSAQLPAPDDDASSYPQLAAAVSCAALLDAPDTSGEGNP